MVPRRIFPERVVLGTEKRKVEQVKKTAEKVKWRMKGSKGGRLFGEYRDSRLIIIIAPERNED